jgi:hypothetical protein
LPRPPTRTLRALSSVGVFAEQADGRFGLTPLAEHLRTDAPGSLRAWAMFLGRPYTRSAWAHLLESVRTGEAAFPKLHGTSYWEYLTPRPEEGAGEGIRVVYVACLVADHGRLAHVCVVGQLREHKGRNIRP